MKKIALITLFLIPSVILANSIVGKVTGLRGIADIKQNSVLKPAKLGSDLFNHDQIITKSNSKVQVVFKDDTIVTIGKNSQFSVDEYIDNGNKSEVKLSIFKGAMRTITGKIGKANPSKFKVKTRTATIGIRGTNFIVFATPESDMVACTVGAITVEGNSGIIDVPNGFMTSIDKSGNVQAIEPFNSGKLGATIDAAFGTTSNKEETSTTEESTVDVEVDMEINEDSLDDTVFIDMGTESLPALENTALGEIEDQVLGETEETVVEAAESFQP